MDSWSNNRVSNGNTSWNGHHTSKTAINKDLDEQKEDDKTSSCSRLWDELDEFGSTTTHHGVHYMTDRKNHALRRIFWLLVVLIGDFYLGVNVLLSILHYLRYDVNTIVGVKYVEDLDFPAITICNYNQFRKSKVSPDLLALLNNINGIEVKFRTEPIDWTMYNLSGTAFEGIFDLNQIEQSAHQINETVVECWWRGVERCGDNNFTATWTDWGVCFTFNDPGNGSEILKTNQPGRQNGLLLRLNVQQNEYVVSERSAAGFKVLLHPQGVRPVMKELGFSVSPGFETSVSVKYTKVVNKPYPYTTCHRETDKPLTYSQKYTVPLCHQECKVNYVVDNCGCRDYRYPGNAPLCGPKGQLECIRLYEAKFVEEKIKCDCNESCNAETYDARTSIAYYPNQDVMSGLNALLNVTEDFLRKNVLDLTIFFEELSYNSIVQRPEYTAESLLSDIGGTMGLMVGMSLITVVVALDFSLIWIWKRLSPSTHPV